MKNIAIALAALILTGCAGTAEYMRSQPTTYFPAPIAQPQGDMKDLIVLRCMAEQEVSFQDANNKSSECLYVSADVSKLVDGYKAAGNNADAPMGAAPGTANNTGAEAGKNNDKNKQGEAIAYLISLADMNCSNFMHRVFAQRTVMGFTKQLTGDLATAASAGTAFSSPGVSAALSVGNLLVGKSIDAFNTNYFIDKTFQAFESAIEAQRFEIRQLIIARQANANGQAKPVVPYPIVEALSDIRAYDDACSLKAGVARLVKIADENKARAEADVQKAKVDPQTAVTKILGTNPDTTPTTPPAAPTPTPTK